MPDQQDQHFENIQAPSKTILLVEDDTTIAELLVQMISQETHYQVFAVPDGPPALDLAKNIKLELLILDYRLPTIHGIELHDRLHDIEGLEQVPILFLGALAATVVADLVRGAVATANIGNPNIFAGIARWAIIGFAALVALEQLKITPDLINELFGAIVLALAIAFGLAFGLGGQEAARRWLARGEGTVVTAASQISAQQSRDDARAAQLQADQMRAYQQAQTQQAQAQSYQEQPMAQPQTQQPYVQPQTPYTQQYSHDTPTGQAPYTRTNPRQ